MFNKQINHTRESARFTLSTVLQTKIPVWKNNRIEYEIPGIVHEQPMICEMAKDVPENYPSEKASDSN